MKRLIGLGAALFLLCACVQQGPHQIVPDMAAAPSRMHAEPPFRPVVPAGYCPSDESDIPGARLNESITKDLEPDEALLGIFRPCTEPATLEGRAIDRLAVFIVQLPPASPKDAEIMDRQMFVTMMANPKVSALLGERILQRQRPLQSGKAVTADTDTVRYLGADDYGAYNGITITPRDASGRAIGASRMVLGLTLTGDHMLGVALVSLGIDAAPHDWKALQDKVAETMRGTVVAAERPSRAVRPAPPQPPKPGASGLST